MWSRRNSSTASRQQTADRSFPSPDCLQLSHEPAGAGGGAVGNPGVLGILSKVPEPSMSAPPRHAFAPSRSGAHWSEISGWMPRCSAELKKLLSDALGDCASQGEGAQQRNAVAHRVSRFS
jgi:hypothetical protein